MTDIFIPLQGPNGVRPKAPAVGAWQSPGYTGRAWDYRMPDYSTGWFGLRCDGLVVIDCDNSEAAYRWLANVGMEGRNTWTRRTPRGWHYIYRATPGSPEGPSAGVWPGIDIRAGRTSQIVFHAPGYSDIVPRERCNGIGGLLPFNPAWLPAKSLTSEPDRSDVESWDEVPDGRGNNTMTAFAGAFRRQGMSPLRIAKCLGAINRICMTQDPMSNEQIAQIVQSICRYTPKPDIDIEAVE